MFIYYVFLKPWNNYCDESSEDYLETQLELKKKKSTVWLYNLAQIFVHNKYMFYTLNAFLILKNILKIIKFCLFGVSYVDNF